MGWILAGCGFGQQLVSPVQTLVVMPFENRSHAPGLEWISEAFPEVLGQRLVSDDIYVLSRDYRTHAYDRAGIPAGVHPSRASLYRIAEQMDVNYAVLGSYSFDGHTFIASAQVLDIKDRRLFPQVQESGPLPKLLEVESGLAWDLLRALNPQYAVPRATVLAAAPALRLDAFENYIRGLLALSEPEKLRRLREAVRLNPAYTAAMLELGKAYFEARDYDAAANWLGRIPNTDPGAREASFLLGLAAYYQGNFPRAETAFRYLLEQFPLTEVANNLAVVSARLSKPDATQLFQKAVAADPSDPDYRFNLGVSLFRGGDLAGASRQLRECLALRSDDNEAKALLAAVNARMNPTPGIKPASAADPIATSPKPPLERVKRTYEEAAFRELALEMQNASESRLGKLDPRTHASFHVQRGRDLLARGFSVQARKELREAAELDASNGLAHALLAEALDLNHDAVGARAEAEAALRLPPSPEVYVALARLNLRENNKQAASGLLGQALKLDPGNAEALVLQQKLDGTSGVIPPVAPKP